MLTCQCYLQNVCILLWVRSASEFQNQRGFDCSFHFVGRDLPCPRSPSRARLEPLLKSRQACISPEPTACFAVKSLHCGHLNFLRLQRCGKGILVKVKRRRCWNTLFPVRTLRPVIVGLKLIWLYFEVRDRRRNTLMNEITWKKSGRIVFSDEVSSSTHFCHMIHLLLIVSV